MVTAAQTSSNISTELSLFPYLPKLFQIAHVIPPDRSPQLGAREAYILSQSNPEQALAYVF